MRFAMVNGEKREAEGGLKGFCIGCSQPVTPKCGRIRVKHWAHQTECECDRWWENETEWHRSWKNNFPIECQEIRHQADDGEWHIADVETKQGHFLEFQHSFLRPEERISRNDFYGQNLVWIVDGLKSQKDRLRFDVTLKNAIHISPDVPLARLPSSFMECSLLREWSECNVPIFFDFGSELLWCLLPKSLKDNLYIGPFSKRNFVDLHNGVKNKNGQDFSGLMRILNDHVCAYENPQQLAALPQEVKQNPTSASTQGQIKIHLNLRPIFSYRQRRRGRL